MPSTLQRNLAGQNITFALVVAATGAAYSGAANTVSVFVTKDNSGQSAGAGTVTALGNGQFNYAPTQGETNATDIGFLFTASTCFPVNVDCTTIQLVTAAQALTLASSGGGLAAGGFLTPVDIANRALQRVGASRIGPLGFNETSKQASETSFCYGKLRAAELERNTWTFATKRAAIRPINLKTAILQPTLWSSVVTYFLGSVVADQNNTLWESTQRNNLNNQPGIMLSAWKPYFGPMTAEPFQSSAFFAAAGTSFTQFNTTFLSSNNAFTGYYKSELVYTIKGDGTFNVYKSLADGNAVHPALPNQWSVDTIYKTDDVVNVYPNWSSLTTYSQGQTVMYTDGNAYASLTNSNLNNIPPASSTSWALMPTLTLQSEFNPASTAVSPVILPGTTPINEWDIETTYSIGSFVMWNAAIYVSLNGTNTGNLPSNATYWVQCTGGTLYQSLVDFNLANTPASSASQWTTSFTLGGGNSLWIQIGGSAFPNGVGLSAFQLTYPIGSGPVSQSWTKNAYRLPAGYLRRTIQDPAAGRNSWLGAPGNLNEDDWTFEDKFLVTWDAQPIVLRFVADMQNVTDFTPMFCEALACRIAYEVCEPLTQSSAKQQMIAQAYKKFITEAILVNGIDKGAQEPPLDDLIATRL